MGSIRTWCLLAAVPIAGAACAKRLTPPADLDRNARTFIAALQRSGVDSALHRAQFTGNADTIRSRLAVGQALVRSLALSSITPIGWTTFREPGVTRFALTYEAEGRDSSAFLTVTFLRSDSASPIVGFGWQATGGRLSEQTAFSFRGRGPRQYLFLALAGLALGLCLTGAIIALTHRMGVLWILFSLVGLGQASINWTTGQSFFEPLRIQLLGVGFMRGAVGPWILSWSIPVGGVLVLVKWAFRWEPEVKPPASPPVAV